MTPQNWMMCFVSPRKSLFRRKTLLKPYGFWPVDGGVPYASFMSGGLGAFQPSVPGHRHGEVHGGSTFLKQSWCYKDFLSHGDTPKSSKSSKLLDSLDHDLVLKPFETYGDLGIPHFKNPPYVVNHSTTKVSHTVSTLGLPGFV